MRELLEEKEREVQKLEPSGTQVEQWLEDLKEFSSRFLNDLPQSRTSFPAVSLQKGKNSWDETPLPQLIDELSEKLLTNGVNTSSGGFFGYIPGGGIPAAAIADYFAALTNRYSGFYPACPGAVHIENEVVRWMLLAFGYREKGWGILLSGGSIANLSAVIAARETRPHSEWKKGVIYLTAQVHHSMQKAIKIAGLAHVPRRIVTTDDQLKMDPEALERQIVKDRENGFSPWILVASAGTTNSGTVDPLENLSEISQKYGLWFHVDAAYGGFFNLTEKGRKVLSGISQADSITLDPHKGLFMPYGVGALLVKDKRNLHNAFSEDADYLSESMEEEEPSPCDYSPELTRHFRALRIWLSFHLSGERPFIAALEEKLLLAEYAHQKLDKIPEIEVGGVPDLSTVVFRVVEEGDTRTQTLLEDVVKIGNTHMTTTRIHGRLFIRMCILCFRTHRENIDLALKEIQENL